MNKAKVKPSKSVSLFGLLGSIGLGIFGLTMLLQAFSDNHTPLPVFVFLFVFIIIVFGMAGWHFLNITKTGGMSHTEIDFERKTSKTKKK